MTPLIRIALMLQRGTGKIEKKDNVCRPTSVIEKKTVTIIYQQEMFMM